MWFLVVVVFIQGTAQPIDLGAGTFDSEFLCKKGIENVKNAYPGFDTVGHCIYRGKSL